MICSCFRYMPTSFQFSQDNLYEPGSSISKLSFGTSNEMHNANNKFYIKTQGKKERKCYLETKGQICEKRAIHYLHTKINITGKAMPAICNYLIRENKKKKFQQVAFSAIILVFKQHQNVQVTGNKNSIT